MPKRSRILVIDDDPLFRSLIVSLLRKDYSVSVADEGSEGFYKALEVVPDVAIIDIQMPGWDGLKTLKAFRGHPALSHVKVIILTGDASQETVMATIQSGANDYVIKTSFSKALLLKKLEKLLAGDDGRTSTVASLRSDTLSTLPTSEMLSVSIESDTQTEHQLDDDEQSRLQEIIDAWE